MFVSSVCNNDQSCSFPRCEIEDVYFTPTLCIGEIAQAEYTALRNYLRFKTLNSFTFCCMWEQMSDSTYTISLELHYYLFIASGVMFKTMKSMILDSSYWSQAVIWQEKRFETNPCDKVILRKCQEKTRIHRIYRLTMSTAMRTVSLFIIREVSVFQNYFE